MARFYKETTKEEFLAKVKKLMVNDD